MFEIPILTAMKSANYQNYINAIFCFAFVFPSISQELVPFKKRYQNCINGDMTIIANNIVNREDYNNFANKPYYNQSNYAQLNDEFEMNYIDIDNDNSTFSSSSAELILENPNAKKILYAGLYWSATYRYASGDQLENGKFAPIDESREAINEIKIKFPNHDNYIDISGEVIFDGYNKKYVKENAPYAVYSDITKYVQDLPNANGLYTVANIRATQGMISGGVAAGWTIFIVYEDPSMSKKFINSYDGFVAVNEKATTMPFNGFEASPVGNVNAKIVFSALEGDNNLEGDQVLFEDSQTKEVTVLENEVRKKTNFFNSSITIENKNFKNRIPDSKNTLGYDACAISVPNSENKIIKNSANEAVLKLISPYDRYFLFHFAFMVEGKEALH